jgi:hypothetical protein
VIRFYPVTIMRLQKNILLLHILSVQLKICLLNELTEILKTSVGSKNIVLFYSMSSLEAALDPAGLARSPWAELSWTASAAKKFAQALPGTRA